MAVINGPAAGGAWLPGTEGDDTINAYGDANALYGYGGTNYLYARGGNSNNLVGGPGIDHMDGGTGVDNLASYQLSSAPVIASLANPSINTGDARGDTYVNIYDLTGSPYGGALYADNSGHNVQLWALGGTNDMFGGTGYATMISGPGADHMVGGSGGGFIDYETATAGVTASILNPSQNTGFAAGDTYSNLHNLGGSGYADVLYADNSGDNMLGGAGNNIMHGGTGNDTLNGGPDASTLYGGASADLFVFGGSAIGPGDVALDPLLILANAKNGIFTTVADFDQGNTGHYDSNEFDSIDVARLLSTQFHQGQAVSSMVRVAEDASNTFATFQVDTDGTGANWLTIAHLNGVAGGGTVRVVFDESQPMGVTLTVPQSVQPPVQQHTAVYSGPISAYTLTSYNGTIAVLAVGTHDRLQDIDTLQFSNGAVAASSVAAFDPWEYLASNSDLMKAFGANPQAGFDHYINNGFSEHRATNSFDAVEYLASNADLIQAFGLNTVAAEQHYVANGFNEGRATQSFDAVEYLASNADLIQAFGLNTVAAEQHYVANGFNEGRATQSFDALEYLASNADLIQAFGLNTVAAEQHYVANGFNEGRATQSFDALEYLASNADLIQAFGLNTVAAEQHYVANGFNEGRTTNSFNAAQYLANYDDLSAAFGNNLVAAEQHYITNGNHEGRTDQAPVINGDGADNTLVAKNGAIMTGGAGADTFVFNSSLLIPATINDFAAGTDHLQISTSSFGHGLVPNGAATLVTAVDLASATHSGSDGYFILDNAGANAGTLYWDANGGGGTDATALVHLTNITSLQSSDFLLA